MGDKVRSQGWNERWKRQEMKDRDGKYAGWREWMDEDEVDEG